MSGKALAYAFDHSPYKGTKKLIHVAIGDVVNDTYDYTFWMANQNLARKCSCDRVTVNKALRQMVDDGYLEVLEEASGRDKTVKYRFIFKGESVANDNTFDQESVASHPESVAFHPGSVANDNTFDSESVAFHPGSVANDNTNSRELKDEDLTQVKLNKQQKRQIVWDAYLESRRKFGQKKTPGLNRIRQTRINEALERYSLEDVILAVTGWVHSPFHRGENEDGKIWNDVELLLRNDQKIDMHIAHHEDVKRRPRDKQEVNYAHEGRQNQPPRKLNIVTIGNEQEDFLDD